MSYPWIMGEGDNKDKGIESAQKSSAPIEPPAQKGKLPPLPPLQLGPLPPLIDKNALSSAIAASIAAEQPQAAEPKPEAPSPSNDSSPPAPLLEELAASGYAAAAPPSWQEPSESDETEALPESVAEPTDSGDAVEAATDNQTPPSSAREEQETTRSAIQRSIAAAMQAEEQARAQPKSPEDRRFLSTGVPKQDAPTSGSFSASKNETYRTEPLKPDRMSPFFSSHWALIGSSAVLMVAATVLILWVVSPWKKHGPSSVDSTSTQKGPAIARKEIDEELAARASRHARNKQYAEAYTEYGLLIDHQPQERQWYVKRAEVVAAEGKLDLAKGDIATLISMDDQKADAYVLSGDLDVRQNLLKEALEEYRKALKLQPGDSSIQQKFALAKLKLAQMPKAKPVQSQEPTEWALSKELRERDPLGAAYQLMVHQQPGEAMPILTQVIKKNPNNLLARRYLAWSASDTQMLEEACEQFGILDRLNALNARDLAKFADCMRQVHPEGAAKVYERASQADPQNQNLREGLCRAYLVVKEYAKCRTAAQYGISLAGEGPQKLKFEEIIAESQEKEAADVSASRQKLENH